MAVPAILQQLGRQNNPAASPQMQNLRRMVGMIRGARDPNALMQQMLQQNPTMQQAMEYVRQNGGDPKAAFYKLAQERGIDPQSVMNNIL